MSAALAAFAAQAWAARAVIEHHAHRRFARLALELGELDPASPVVALLRAAADEEARHARLCTALAGELGVSVVVPERTARVAPAHLGRREAVLYEVVAACCIAETESMATLTLLLSKLGAGPVKDVVRQIARDEVDHAQAGWAHLAREAQAGHAAALAGWLVPMLDTAPVHALFAPAADPVADDEGLFALGVVPHRTKRQVFVDVLEQLVFPGLRAQGVDDGAGRLWLAARLSAAEAAAGGGRSASPSPAPARS